MMGEPAQLDASLSPDEQDKHRLTTLSGLAALSLDALSSVAYRPEAIVIVLMAAGTAGLDYTLPVTLAIVILLGVLVISYRQVIAAFPGGGGFVLDRAIRKGTENVVICRLRFQRSTWSAPDFLTLPAAVRQTAVAREVGESSGAHATRP